MTDFVSNLIKKFKKTSPQKDSTTSIKSNSRNLVSEESILLNEQVKINIYSLKEVNIDKEGVITGNIHSKSCIVNGKVNGNILSSEYIEVKNTAVIEGNIKSGSIQIEAGSMINGFISIEKKIKLPTILPQVEPAAIKIHNDTDELEKMHPSAKLIVPNNEAPEIKTKPIVTRPSESETQTEVPKIKTEVPEIRAVITEIVPQTNKTISETVKKEETTTENPSKKLDIPSSNDSWW